MTIEDSFQKAGLRKGDTFTTQSTNLHQLSELVEYCLETRQKVKELETGLELAENSLLQAFRTTGMERLGTPKAIAYIESGRLIVKWKERRK